MYKNAFSRLCGLVKETDTYRGHKNYEVCCIPQGNKVQGYVGERPGATSWKV